MLANNIMITASATATATAISTAKSFASAINTETGETATATASASASDISTSTATATGVSYDITLDSALNSAMQNANVNAIKLALAQSSAIANKIANDAATKDVSPVNPITVNPFYPLTFLEQTNISEYFLTNILAGQNVPINAFLDLVVLKEPKKADIILFQQTGVLPVRKAEVGIYYISEDQDLYNLYEVTLVDEQVTEISIPTAVPRRRANYNNPENDKVLNVVLQDPACRAALISKGLTEDDIDNHLYFDVAMDSRLDLINEIYGPNFSDFIYETTPRPRVWFLTPYWVEDASYYNTRGYIQPIDTLLFFVNSRTSTVMKIYDPTAGEPPIPIQKGNTDYTRPLAPNLNPIITILPQGPSYTVSNNVVEWAGWQFTWSTHPVTGLSIYNVSFLDRTVWKENPDLAPVRRSILYKANIGELITCYGEKSISGTIRNFFDFGEYPIRDFSSELIPGIDIPEYASLFEYIFTDTDGTVNNLPNRVGIYERQAGMLWRHTDDLVDGRSGRELVVTFLTVISNYDYLFNWIFTQDGEIHFELLPSGIIEGEATLETSMAGHTDHPDEELVLSNVYGVKHSHPANIRIDFAVDGLINKIEQHDIERVPVSQENPYGNQFVETSTLLTTELDAIRDTDFTKARKWVVRNESSKNYLGYERGYEIVPFPTPFPYDVDERISKRATYILHSLHVTQYHDDELYTAGQFVTEDAEDRGLAIYVADDEPIVNEDIVVWYTFGFSHPTRIEDVPVMPTERMGFKIIPHNFFNESPGMYIPKTEIQKVEN